MKILYYIDTRDDFQFNNNDYNEWTLIVNLKENKIDEFIKNISNNKIELSIQKVLQGRKVHNLIITFHNWLFTLIHLSLPKDCNNESRISFLLSS